VAEDRVVWSTSLPAQAREQIGRKCIRHPSLRRSGQAGDRLEVDTEDETFGTDLARRDLTPSAWRRTEIEGTCAWAQDPEASLDLVELEGGAGAEPLDRKSTRLNSSHVAISYAVFCLK